MNRNISQILSEIYPLELEEKLKLLELIAHNINSISQQKSLDWNKLYGLGKGVWNGEDAQVFINNLREDR